MKKIPLLFLFVIFSVSGYCGEIRNLLQHLSTEAELKNLLVTNKSWVPYPAYKDRAGWERLTAPVREQLIANGEKYLDFKWRVVKATDYIEYERSGSRAAMEEPFGANSNALTTLILAELSEGKGRFIDQIINGVWLFSEMTSWALSAHLPSSQASKRTLPEITEHVIDLTSGDLGSLLSWTYYFFKEPFDVVNPSISSRLLSTLKERILDTYMQRSDFWWQAIDLPKGGLVNNWNPWCNFNVLTCFMLLEENPEKLAAGVYRTMVSVDQFINYNHSDGACEEGPSYWGHAAGKMYDYLQLLSYATKGKVSVFKDPMIRNMGEYISRSYVGDGWVVNFADASAKGGGNALLIYRYGQAVNSTEMQQFAAYLLEQDKKKYNLSFGRDIFRAMEDFRTYPALENTKAALPKAAYTWYNETEFLYLRNEGLFFAAKGGFNNESHNHNDVGTFSLYVDNVPFFIDAGVGTYTRQTFSNERYSIWTMQSSYHNLPKINGFDQQFGNNFRSRNVKFEEAKKEFSLDISNAYPASAGIKKWIRDYRLEGRTLLIRDEFQLQKAEKPNEINFLTWAKPDLTKAGEVMLEKNGKKVRLIYPAGSFTIQSEEIPLPDPRLSNVWGNQIYRIILKDKKERVKGSYQFRIEVL